MPPVRTSTAAPLQVAGSTGPRASAASFAPSFAGAAQGLSQVPGALAAVAGARKDRQKEAALLAREGAMEAKKELDNSQKLAALEGGIDLESFSDHWLRDENTPNLSPDQAQIVLKGKIDDVVAERGLIGDREKEFRIRAKAWVNNNMLEQEVARKGRADSDFNLRIGRAIDASVRRYYNDGDSEILIDLRDQIHRQVAEKFDDNQALVAQLRKKYDTIFAEAMTEMDPESAEAFIDETSYIDARDRPRLLEKAKVRAATKDAGEVYKLELDASKAQKMALEGKDFPISEQRFIDVLGEKAGKDAYKVHSLKQETNRQAYDVVDMYAGMNPAAIEKARRGAETTKDPITADAHFRAYDQLQEALKHRIEDPAYYQAMAAPHLAEYEAEVNDAYERYQRSPNDVTQNKWQAAQTDLNQQKLAYQGYGNSPYHLKLPAHLRSLLTNERAKAEANRIKTAKPEEVIEAWKQIFSEFPDPTHQWIVFDDIAAQGLDFEHIMGFFVRGEPFAQTFIQAQREDDLKPASGTRDQFVADVKAHDDFKLWAEGQRAVGAPESYINSGAIAIAKYGMVLSNRSNFGDPVEVAVTNLFGWQHKIDVGDNVIAIDKRGVPLESIQTLEEFLPDAVMRLNLENIHPEHFEDEVGFFNKEDRDKFVRAVVSGEGATWLSPTIDGKRIQLMAISGLGGDITVIENSKGVPYSLHVDDLPKKVNGVWMPSQGGLSNWPFKPLPVEEPVTQQGRF